MVVIEEGREYTKAGSTSISCASSESSAASSSAAAVAASGSAAAVSAADGGGAGAGAGVRGVPAMIAVFRISILPPGKEKRASEMALQKSAGR